MWVSLLDVDCILFWITGETIPVDGLPETVKREWLLRCWSRADSRKLWLNFIQVSAENSSCPRVIWKIIHNTPLEGYGDYVMSNILFHSRNEKEGIPVELIQHLDVCVEVPQEGVIRSMNVHVTGAIFIWEYVRQQIGLPRWKLPLGTNLSKMMFLEFAFSISRFKRFYPLIVPYFSWFFLCKFAAIRNLSNTIFCILCKKIYLILSESGGSELRQVKFFIVARGQYIIYKLKFVL